ncbi:DUF551 domain-containing protein [Pseudomonas vanderleydeniana]|uniref:DUF551 domain-containing protein n=1 Tax=Pseudomonas vanderleydeniana TaxID=2745495 RepID=A0A9E6PP54_9PSED|nr:DUF551 domain-containing protein [Pseudomonas vanderleydeniana]QXI30487.1 DUF551 domain-containing protein [Pseudomonas vanderleydeniana]
MSQWIKCSDRLPGDELDGMMVIVAVQHCRRGLIAEADIWRKGKRKGSFDFWSKATHWQPLPAPPDADELEQQAQHQGKAVKP